MVKRMAALALGAALFAAATPGARAQGDDAAGLSIPTAERAALLPVRQAIDAGAYPAAATALQAARPSVRSGDGRYALARLQLEIAAALGDRAGLITGTANLLQLRRSSEAEQVVLLKQYAALIFDAGNPNGAEATLNRAAALAPNDAEVLAMLGQVTRARGNVPQAIGYFQRAFRIVELGGGRMSETRYRLALGLAQQARQRPAAVEFARLLVTNYPSAINWRDALNAFRTVDAPADPALSLDTLRLMRATGAIAGERDVLASAQAAAQAGSPADAKAILDDGATRGMTAGTDAPTRALLTSVTPGATTERNGLAARVTRARAATAGAADARAAADGLFAQGRYAEAAEFYQLALTRTGEDPNLLNARLGETLALAGRRAEAETALRAVAPGPRADLAALWLAWLARAPAA